MAGRYFCHPVKKSAGEESGQNRVFRHVCAFSHDQLHLGDRGWRHIGNEPVQEGPDNPRGVFRRHHIGGSDENHDQPDDERQPVEDEIAEILVQAKPEPSRCRVALTKRLGCPRVAFAERTSTFND